MELIENVADVTVYHTKQLNTFIQFAKRNVYESYVFVTK